MHIFECIPPLPVMANLRPWTVVKLLVRNIYVLEPVPVAALLRTGMSVAFLAKSCGLMVRRALDDVLTSARFIPLLLSIVYVPLPILTVRSLVREAVLLMRLKAVSMVLNGCSESLHSLHVLSLPHTESTQMVPETNAALMQPRYSALTTALALPQSHRQ